MKDIDGGKIPESAFKLLRWVSFPRFLHRFNGDEANAISFAPDHRLKHFLPPRPLRSR